MGVVKDSVRLLGQSATDKVTGFSGVITTVSFDLYGCIQVALTPKAKDGDQELKHGHWFDVHRLDIDQSLDRVMPVPDFNAYCKDATRPSPGSFTHGPAMKPEPR